MAKYLPNGIAKLLKACCLLFIYLERSGSLKYTRHAIYCIHVLLKVNVPSSLQKNLDHKTDGAPFLFTCTQKQPDVYSS